MKENALHINVLDAAIDNWGGISTLFIITSFLHRTVFVTLMATVSVIVEEH